MLTIRPAHRGDAAAIMRVHREAIFAKAAGHYAEQTLAAWGREVTAERVARMQDEIANPEFRVLVAEAGGEVIGFAVAVPARNQLRALYVKPNAVGRVGSALLRELETLAFQTAEFLSCDASLNAAEFYRAHGYTEQGVAEHVLSSGAVIPCIRMKKRRPSV
jgi:L-amino acid N-acyltransferase YncA